MSQNLAQVAQLKASIAAQQKVIDQLEAPQVKVDFRAIGRAKAARVEKFANAIKANSKKELDTALAAAGWSQVAGKDEWAKKDAPTFKMTRKDGRFTILNGTYVELKDASQKELEYYLTKPVTTQTK